MIYNLRLLKAKIKFLWRVGSGVQSHFRVQPNYSVVVVLYCCLGCDNLKLGKLLVLGLPPSEKKHKLNLKHLKLPKNHFKTDYFLVQRSTNMWLSAFRFVL